MMQKLAQSKYDPPKDGKRFRVVTVILRNGVMPSGFQYEYAETPKEAWDLYNETIGLRVAKPRKGRPNPPQMISIEVWFEAEGLWINYNEFLRRMAY